MDSRDALFEASNRKLLAMLPADQAERVFNSRCDIEPEFLGFVEIYERLAEIVPAHWAVVDLGCAYAPQAFFFRRHKVYVGVDMSECERFSASNTKHYKMPIKDFIDRHVSEFNQNTTFAICSYVPPWGADNGELVRRAFRNAFVFYPSGEGPVLKGRLAAGACHAR